jgi:gliding motility-associated-like protein
MQFPFPIISNFYRCSIALVIGLVFSNILSYSQEVLNGDFECHNHGCQYNMPNAEFNAGMPYVTAFGLNSEVDIQERGCRFGDPANGNWFISVAKGSPSINDEVSMELSTPLIAGTEYKLTYYDKCLVERIPDYLEIGVSNNETDFGIQIFESLPVKGAWTKREITFNSPINALYITARNKTSGNFGAWTFIDNFFIEQCDLEIDLGNDISICDGASMELVAEQIPEVNYIWQDGSTGRFFEATSSGIYWVELSKNCCVFRDSIEITLGNDINLNLGEDKDLCISETIRLNPKIISGVSYLWQDGTTTNYYDADESGLYWLEIRLNDCVNRDTIVLNFHVPPIVKLREDTAICNNPTFELFDSDPDFDNLWSNGTSGNSISVSATGWYWLEMTSICGTFRDSIYVTVDEPLYPIPLFPYYELCKGDSISLLSGLEQLVFWNQQDSLDTFQVKTAGKYYYSLENLCGLVSDTTFIEVFDGLPNFTLSNDTILCKESILTISPSDQSINYVWQDGISNQAYQASSTGWYWAESENICGKYRDSIYVLFEEPYVPKPLFSNYSICKGDSVALYSSLDQIVFWNNTDSLDTLWVKEAGKYYYSIENTCGVVSDTTIVDVVDGLPVFLLNSDTILCTGTNLNLKASDPLLIYEWQDGSVDSELKVTNTGWYWAESTNLCGTYRDSVHVLFETPLTYLGLGNDTTLCDGKSIWLQGLKDLDHFWNNGSIKDSVLVDSSGVYWIEAENTCGTLRDSIAVTFIDSIVPFNLGNDTVLCAGDSVILSVNGKHPNLIWNTSAFGTSIIVKQTGWYWAESSNLCGIFRDSIYVAFDSVLVPLNLGNDTTLCSGDSIWLFGGLGVNHIWNDGSSLDSVFIDSSGIYWVEQSNTCGILRDSITVVFVDSIVPFNLGNDTVICEGDSVTLSVVGIHNNVLWSTGETDTSIAVNNTGRYWVQSSNACGVVEDSIYIKVDTNLIGLDLGNDTILCLGDSLILTIPAKDALWIWSTGSIDSSIYIGQKDTIISIQMFNTCDTVSDTINIQFQGSLPVFNLPSDTLICEIDSFTLNYTYPGATNLWSDGGTDATMTIDTTGLYWLSMSNECGTIGDSMNVIELMPLSLIDLGDDTTVCEYTDITFDVGQFGVSYLWNDSSTDSFIVANDYGIYWVEASNQCGLIRDSIEIIWSYCGCELFMPNAFTPNGDGRNETYKPSINCIVSDYRFTIFDRWGKMIFETTNQNQGWDDSIGGMEPKEDTYAYELYWTYPNQEPMYKKGRVSLIW